MDDPRAGSADSRVIDSTENASPLSIALVAPEWPPGQSANGVIPYIDQIGSEMRRLGHSVAILAGSIQGEVGPGEVHDLKPHEPSNRVLTRAIDWLSYRVSWNLGQNRQFPRAVIREAERLAAVRGLDLVEMEESYGWASPVRRRLGLPVVVRLHGPWFLNGPLRSVPLDRAFRKRVRLEGRAIAEADLVTSPSIDVLERTRTHYGLSLKNAQVIPNPTGSVPQADQWRVEASDPDQILFVGRFDRHKGGDLMIDAFARLARRRASARLRFVGPDIGVPDDGGRVVQIHEYIGERAPDAADRIEVMGQLPHGKLLDLRKRARVNVICSRYETFGMVLAESLMMGCPTVATRAGAFPEILQDGVHGLLCRPEDPTDLADKIDALLEDEPLATRLGHQAAIDTERRFNSRVVVQEITRYYRSLIGSRERPGREETSR